MTMLRGEEVRVGFAELFYDLVFVFAVTQVSHYLLYHYSLAGAAQTGLLFLAVWWVWIYTTWALNRLDPEAGPVRLMLFAMMAAGLFLSMAIPEAFGTRGWVFGLAMAGMQVGRTLFLFLILEPGSQGRTTYRRILIWLCAAGVFWVLGGFAPPEARFAIWSLALLVEFGGPAFAYRVPGLGRDVTANWEVRGGHIAERCGLFVIICLGETLLISGATFAGMEWTAAGMGSFLGAVLGTVAMWWVYFNVGHKRGALQIEHSDDPGRIARLSFTYLHVPIVAGVVLAAVASERAIAHPLDAGVWAEGLTMIGGPALFLLGNGLFKGTTSARGWFPLSHLLGLGACALVFLAGPWLPLVALNAAAAGIMIFVGVWEHRSVGGVVVA